MDPVEEVNIGDGDFTGDDRDYHWLIAFFEFELCGDCGRDHDEHDVGPDMFGNRHAWCRVEVDDHDPS